MRSLILIADELLCSPNILCQLVPSPPTVNMRTTEGPCIDSFSDATGPNPCPRAAKLRRLSICGPGKPWRRSRRIRTRARGSELAASCGQAPGRLRVRAALAPLARIPLAASVRPSLSSLPPPHPCAPRAPPSLPSSSSSSPWLVGRSRARRRILSATLPLTQQQRARFLL